ncbi:MULTISPECIES: hypothetical protein [unclassified Okeania]|nr:MULTISPECIES: hypothetical protein [unclassified Okeania]
MFCSTKYLACAKYTLKKEEGRRKKEEGRRKKEEGRKNGWG